MYEIFKTWVKLLLGRGYNKSFGQFGEDAVLQTLLQKKKATYIDVGAYHPVLYSNTYAFYKRGWSGVVIDANLNSKLLFNVFRPRDTFINAAVGKEGTKTYYNYSDPAFNQLSDIEPPLPNGVSLVSKDVVKVIPLETLVGNIGPVDLLNIDVEGLDLEVLETYDWNNPPRVIAIEVHDFNAETPKNSPAYVFLHEKGYRLTALCGVTLIFTTKYRRA